MFDLLARWAVDHPWKVFASWIIVGIGLTMIAPDWRNQSQDDDIRFLPPTSASVRGFQLLERGFPQDVFACRAIFALERPDRPLSTADLALADRLAASLDDLRNREPDLKIGSVASRRDALVGSRLVSADRKSALIQLSLGTPYLAVQTREAVDRAERILREELAKADDPPALYVTGPAGVGRDLISAGASSLDHTTLATVVLVVIVLLAVYRAPILALIPLATIGISVWVALEILALITLIPGVHLVNVSQVFAVVILFGAGTDYCLFLISRYREELGLGKYPPAALQKSVRAVGGALAASAGTVVCGLGLMGFAEFAKIRCAGPVIGLALTVGLLASLTLTPALLRLTGRSAFWVPWQRRPRLAAEPAGPQLWDRLADIVVARPVWVLVASVIILLPLAILGFNVKATFSPIGDLSPFASSVRGLDVIRTHFTAGETGPLTVLLASDKPWDSAEGKAVIRHLSRGFVRLDNVAEVRSLTQPLGQPMDLPDTKAGNLLGGIMRLAGKADPLSSARAHYLADRPDSGGPRYVARLDVVLKSDPFAAASIATLETIETWLRELLPEKAEKFGKVQAECYGVTVQSRDMAAVIERDRTRVNLLVLAGIFAILVVVVRKLWLAGYLLATVLLSYYATLGITTLFAVAWAGKPLCEVEWRVPFFLFTILVAVGEDYNILVITRAMQERKRHGAVDGIRRGLARTGGTITACGVIMAGTFTTLMISGLSTLVQIGFALGVGVLLDTLVIRPFLVPAFVLIIWRDEEQVPDTIPFRPLMRRPPQRYRRVG